MAANKLVAVMALWSQSVLAVGFEVSGRLTTDYGFTSGPYEYRFQMRVDGCRWVCRVQPLGEAIKAAGVQYYEDAFDGSQMYSYAKFVERGNRQSVNTSQAVIDTNNIPCESSLFAAPLWIAFGSSCYFNTSNTDSIPDIFDSGSDVVRLANRAIRCSRQMHHQPPHLPTSADFFSDGFVYSRDDNLRIQKTPLFSPFNQGYRSHVFRANTFTNVGESWIPLEFALQFFLPSGGAKSTHEVRQIAIWTGRVEAVLEFRSSSAKEFIPETDGAALTEDRRFPPVGSRMARVSYLNTNTGTWPAATNDRVAGVYRELLENDMEIQSIVPDRPNATTKRVFLIALMLGTILPIGAIFLARSRRATQSH